VSFVIGWKFDLGRTFKYAGGFEDQATIRTLPNTTGMLRSAKCQAGETLYAVWMQFQGTRPLWNDIGRLKAPHEETSCADRAGPFGWSDAAHVCVRWRYQYRSANPNPGLRRERHNHGLWNFWCFAALTSLDSDSAIDGLICFMLGYLAWGWGLST
jgi:hypothetical protein